MLRANFPYQTTSFTISTLASPRQRPNFRGSEKIARLGALSENKGLFLPVKPTKLLKINNIIIRL